MQVYKNLTPYLLNIVDLGVSFKPKGSPTGDTVNLLDYKKAEEIEKSDDLREAVRKGLLSLLNPPRRVVKEKPLKVETVKKDVPELNEDGKVNAAYLCRHVIVSTNQQCKRRPLKDQDYCSSHVLREEINLDV